MKSKTIKTPEWHKNLYDKWFIDDQLNSPYFRKYAQAEADFLVKKLKLKSGMSLLDVPCGAGRHAVEFAKLGINVTAIDINTECLKYTRKNCKGLPVTAQKADMRDLSQYREKYDVATNLFTSFGYFPTDEENEMILKELISTLKPGGKLALHLINRDWLMKVFRPVDWKIKGDVLELEARKYDPKTKYNESYLIILNQKTGKAKSYYHRTRLYSKSEIVRLLKRCGLKNVKVYPACSTESFTKQENSHPLYVGQKLK